MLRKALVTVQRILHMDKSLFTYAAIFYNERKIQPSDWSINQRVDRGGCVRVHEAPSGTNPLSDWAVTSFARRRV